MSCKAYISCKTDCLSCKTAYMSCKTAYKSCKTAYQSCKSTYNYSCQSSYNTSEPVTIWWSCSTVCTRAQCCTGHWFRLLTTRLTTLVVRRLTTVVRRLTTLVSRLTRSCKSTYNSCKATLQHLYKPAYNVIDGYRRLAWVVRLTGVVRRLACVVRRLTRLQDGLQEL